MLFLLGIIQTYTFLFEVELFRKIPPVTVEQAQSWNPALLLLGLR